jgi:hypothetical protein
MKRSLLPFLCLLLGCLLAACSPQIDASTVMTSPTAPATRMAQPTSTAGGPTGEPDPAGTPAVTAEPAEEAGQAADPTPEIEASPAPTATATTEPSEPTPEPTATPNCTNNLVYLADLTIEDGAVVGAGEALDKRWQVENTGTCAWDERYRLRLVEGEALGAPEEQALYPALSGAQVPLRLLLTAPTEPGVYRSAWQAADPQGELFGDPVYIEIVVEATN